VNIERTPGVRVYSGWVVRFYVEGPDEIAEIPGRVTEVWLGDGEFRLVLEGRVPKGSEGRVIEFAIGGPRGAGVLHHKPLPQPPYVFPDDNVVVTYNLGLDKGIWSDDAYDQPVEP